MREQLGNVLDLREGIVAHGCNTLGKMGAGFADQVRRKYPEAFAAYKSQEREEGLILGRVSFAQVGERLWIANVLTQSRIYGPPGVPLADPDAIEAGFRVVGDKARELGLPVEMPMIGCGLAHGVWADIEPRIAKGLGEGVESRLWVFQPAPAPRKAYRR